MLMPFSNEDIILCNYCERCMLKAERYFSVDRDKRNMHNAQKGQRSTFVMDFLSGGCQSVRRSIHFYFTKLLLLFERRLMYFRTLAFVCACHHARVNTQLCLCNSLRDSTARETFFFIHVHYECCNLFSRDHDQKRRSHADFCSGHESTYIRCDAHASPHNAFVVIIRAR